MSTDNDDHAIVPEWELEDDVPEPVPDVEAETSTYEQTTTTTSKTSYVDGKYFLYLFIGIVLMVVSGFALYYIVNHRDEIIAAASASKQ